MNGSINGVCANENTGWCMTSYRELWQYDASTDTWQKLSSLYGGPYTRYSTRVVYDNGFVYVLGGYTYTAYGYEDLSDFWRYNLSTKNWEYIYLCQYTYNSSASKFIYNDKILMIPCIGYNINCKAEITF
jgi:N-acetylneuraminic acid mutarotase